MHGARVATRGVIMMRKTWLTALQAGLLSLPGLALAQPGEGYWGPHMMWGGWFHMFFGFLMMLLFLGIIVVLVVLGVRWLGGSEHSPFRHGPRQGERAALDILKERLARGEIDVAEFEERRRALGE
jgi:putative membrane protein